MHNVNRSETKYYTDNIRKQKRTEASCSLNNCIDWFAIILPINCKGPCRLYTALELAQTSVKSDPILRDLASVCNIYIYLYVCIQSDYFYFVVYYSYCYILVIQINHHPNH